jgi:hypothetical protein
MSEYVMVKRLDLERAATKLERAGDEHGVGWEIRRILAAAAPREPAPGAGEDNWIDVSERKPSNAQEVLFVLDGKTVAGAWIGDIFWYSNKPHAALWWQPFPEPRLSAKTKRDAAIQNRADATGGNGNG